MSDRPTPETDAEHLKFRMGGFTLDFCRKLERERNEAREALADWENAAAHVEADHPDERHCGCVPVLRKLLSDARKERDEARIALASITEVAQAVVDRWEQPSWKDSEPTAAVIYRLRDALGREAQ